MVLLNSFEYPESNVRYEEGNIKAILNKKDLGSGKLIISESTLCWQEKEDVGFSIGYRNISLHAISKDQNVYPRDCIFIMIDGRLTMPGDETPAVNNDEDSDEDEDDYETQNSELLLIPSEENINNVSSIYEVIKTCQELNPDPDMMDDENDDDNLYIDAENEVDEDHYIIQNREAGVRDMDNITRILEETMVHANGLENDEEEFQDAD